MLAYVDESGCTGMRLNKGATPFFTVTAVLFDQRDEATRCFERIESLKTLLKVPREFHFTNLTHDRRISFFEEMKHFQFEYVAVAFDKNKIASEGLVLSQPLLHYQAKAIFAAVAHRMNNSTIVIDKTGSSAFRKKLAIDLKHDLNRQFERVVIRKIKELESHKHPLLQLADMTCGAVARSLQRSKKGPDCYRQIIKQRERLVSVWPVSA
ncbi:MAG: DUF3800 domain-containing protein [Pseudohongiella sp.]|uniref:DUF3800 domain-containing protein n=1 Tax=Pseudohongiella sp. TaxID=1979412 RepID=UPI00349FD65C